MKIMENIRSILIKRTPAKIAPLTRGATYSWQDRAVEVWKKLIGESKPSKQWFRVFKLYPGLCERAYSNMADAGKKATPEKYFYWLIGYYRKGSKK